MSKYSTVEVYQKDIDGYLEQYDKDGFSLVSCTQTRPASLTIGETSARKVEAKVLLIFKQTHLSKDS